MKLFNYCNTFYKKLQVRLKLGTPETQSLRERHTEVGSEEQLSLARPDSRALARSLLLQSRVAAPAEPLSRAPWDSRGAPGAELPEEKDLSATPMKSKQTKASWAS